MRRWIALGGCLLILGLVLAVTRRPPARRLETFATWPEVSPDAERVLFQRGSSTKSGPAEIRVAILDRGTDQRVADGEQAMWMSDGRLLFLPKATKPGATTIAMVDLDGSRRTDVEVPVAEVWRPNVSADGRTIAFGTFLGGPLYVVGIDGSHFEELRVSVSGALSEPTWSHHGRLAFVAWHRRFPWIARWIASTTVYTMNADGSDPRSLATLPDQAQWISWSPDDQHLAVQVDHGVGSAQIAVIDVSTGAVRMIASDAVIQMDETPSWGTDGRLYFQTGRNGQIEIYRMAPDGSGQQPVVTRLAR